MESYDQNEFCFALNQPAVDHICRLVCEATHIAMDGGTFTMDLAKEFVIDCVKLAPESGVKKFEE